MRSAARQLRRYGVVREVRGRGVLLGVELVRDTASMAPFPELGAAMKRTALDAGLIIRVDLTWFAVSPALTATDAEVDALADLVELSLTNALTLVRGASGAPP